MKSLTGWTKVLLAGLGVVCSVFVFSCAQNPYNQANWDRILIDKDGVVFPGTKISETDEKALNAILSQYNKSLYRIDTFKEGKLVVTRGRLNTKFMGQAEVRELARNAQASSLSGWTYQLGYYPGANVGGRTTKQPNFPSPIPNPVKPVPPASSLAQARELVKQVSPILQKYSSNPSGGR